MANRPRRSIAAGSRMSSSQRAHHLCVNNADASIVEREIVEMYCARQGYEAEIGLAADHQSE